MSPVGRWAILLWLCGSALLSCSRVTDRDAKRREFARLNRAVELLQHAPNERKASFVRALDQEGCRYFCKFRQECLRAYGMHQQALDLLSELKSQLDTEPSEGRPHSPDPGPSDGDFLSKEAGRDAARKLAQAKSLLVLARSKTKACADRQGKLVRSWGR